MYAANRNISFPSLYPSNVVCLQIIKTVFDYKNIHEICEYFDGLFSFFGLGNKVTLPYCYRSSEMSEYPAIPTCTIISANKQVSSEMTDIALSYNIMLLSGTSMDMPLITHQQDDQLQSC
jgi:hypothetical protein